MIQEKMKDIAISSTKFIVVTPWKYSKALMRTYVQKF